jgi:hypothetical protein
MTDIALYIDLDGVLADFVQGAADRGFDAGLFNRPTAQLSDVGKKEQIAFYEAIAFSDFYAELPLMPDALELWRAVLPHDPLILTGLPTFRHRDDARAAFEHAAEGKRAWCARILGLSKEQVICTRSRDKKDYVGNLGRTHSVLIDDRKRNIREWREAGGIGVVHVSSKQSVRELRETLTG